MPVRLVRKWTESDKKNRLTDEGRGGRRRGRPAVARTEELIGNYCQVRKLLARQQPDGRARSNLRGPGQQTQLSEIFRVGGISKGKNVVLRRVRFRAGQGDQHATDDAMPVLIEISAVRGGVDIVLQDQLIAFRARAQLYPMLPIQPGQSGKSQGQQAGNLDQQQSQNYPHGSAGSFGGSVMCVLAFQSMLSVQ